MNNAYDPACRKCPRLARFLENLKAQQPGYFCKPVPPFGDPRASLLIVGLAPGMHGANRTGRPFTGDHAGILLYSTLHRFGFATAACSIGTDDGLELRGVRITNAVKCLPPQNKPQPAEVRTCNAFLRAELAEEHRPRVVLALGVIAHAAVLRACDLKAGAHRFAHGALHRLGDRVLLDSYHCSRYNTQTRRLTPEMFETVVATAARLAA
ncbi:MAG: uracil-DNA glycosylase [Steroidobacteraceae bacterium]|nr:uracil-DNA glycosylase [Steroidobacteraceae bacterium]